MFTSPIIGRVGISLVTRSPSDVLARMINVNSLNYDEPEFEGCRQHLVVDVLSSSSRHFANRLGIAVQVRLPDRLWRRSFAAHPASRTLLPKIRAHSQSAPSELHLASTRGISTAITMSTGPSDDRGRLFQIHARGRALACTATKSL